jgi:DnaJ-class molecular chaperone
VNSSRPNHYETLGLDRNCTDDDIRQAYRALAKMYHPDVNKGDAERIKAINDAVVILKDPVKRCAYDAELDLASAGRTRRGAPLPIKEEIYASFQELLRGAELEVHVRDPANPAAPEIYPLDLPAGTAPGTRFTIKREPPFAGGVVQVKIKMRPDARFKARGSDLKCDLKIPGRRAESGGIEMMRGPEGSMLTVKIPARIGRGDTIRIEGQGLPKPRGGRGDLLVRIMYRPEVRISRGFKRASNRPVERRRLAGG